MNRSPNGVVGSEVFDCYVGAERDVERAIVGGAVAAILDGTSRRVGLFPRGAPYFVALSGEARFRSDRALATTRDVSSEVRRGDAVGLWLRGERPASPLLKVYDATSEEADWPQPVVVFRANEKPPPETTPAGPFRV